MRLRPHVIGAVLKKDLLVLWPVVLITNAMWLVSVLAITGVFPTPPGLEMLFNLLPIAAVLAVLVLTFGLAHQDPVPGVGQDWLTRPVAPLELVAAKLAFLLLTILAPLFITAIGSDLAVGRSLAETFSFQLSAWSFIFAAPVGLALASLTRNLLEAIAALFGALILFVGALLGVTLLNLVGAIGSVGGSGFQWIAAEAAVYLGVILSVILLVLLYGKRRVLLARLLALPSIGLVGLVIFAFPWSTALAVQEAVMPGSPPPPALKISPGPDCITDKGAFTDVRFAVNGVPTGSTLVVDRMVSDDPQDGRLAGVEVRHAVAGPDGSVRLTRRVRPLIDAEGRPRPIHVTAVMSVLTADKPVAVRLTKERQRIPGAGWCGVTSSIEGRILDCSLDRGVTKVIATIDGEALPCTFCPTDYRPMMHQRPMWRLKPDAAGTATIQAFRYHSTVEQETAVSAQFLANPTLCPAPGFARIPEPLAPQ